MSETGPKSVRVGVFRRIDDADRAVRALVDAGFDREHVSVICPTCTQEKWQDHAKRELPAGARAPAAAAGGSAIGALLGGLVGVTGAIASGGTALLIAGPVLLGGAAGGAVAGGLIGAMSTRGVEKEIADYYDQALQKGRILVAVEEHGPDGAELLARAERVLEQAGAEPIALTEG